VGWGATDAAWACIMIVGEQPHLTLRICLPLRLLCRVYVELPEPGTSFKAGDSFGSVESVKAASDVYMPVAAKIVQKNTSIIDKPQLVNESALKDGWFVTVQVSNPKEVEALMDAKAYEKHCTEE